MAGKKSRNSKTVHDLIYVAVAVVLIIGILVMYRGWKQRRSEFSDIVSRAKDNESIVEIRGN